MSVIEHVTCPICGCLCDDIAVTVDNNEVVKIKNGCAVCEAKFLGYKCEHRIRQPLIRKDGKFVCQWHGAEFAMADGRRLRPPAPSDSKLMFLSTRLEGDVLNYVWGE